MEDEGAVYTCYHSTIFYHENKFHERMIAALAYRAQTIPIDHADMTALAMAPAALSPDVFVFADIPVSVINEFLARGFQRVFILGGTGDYPFGARSFNWSEIHEPGYLKLMSGVLALRVVEMALTSAIPDYKPIPDDIKRDDGQNLYDGLMSLQLPLEATLVKMCESYQGYEQCIAMIARGKTLRDHRAYIARLRFEQAIIYQHTLGKNKSGEGYLIGLVCAPDFNPDFLRQKIPGVAMTIMWNFVCSPRDTPLSDFAGGSANESTGDAAGKTPPNGYAMLNGIPKPVHCEYYYHMRVTYADRAETALFLKKFSSDITHVQGSIKDYFSCKVTPDKFQCLMPST